MLSDVEVYYEKVQGCDSIARGGLLLRKKLKIGGFKSVLAKWLCGLSLQLVPQKKMSIDIILLIKS